MSNLFLQFRGLTRQQRNVLNCFTQTYKDVRLGSGVKTFSFQWCKNSFFSSSAFSLECSFDESCVSAAAWCMLWNLEVRSFVFYVWSKHPLTCSLFTRFVSLFLDAFFTCVHPHFFETYFKSVRVSSLQTALNYCLFFFRFLLFLVDSLPFNGFFLFDVFLAIATTHLSSIISLDDTCKFSCINSIFEEAH